jgi:hypothetical protein
MSNLGKRREHARRGTRHPAFAMFATFAMFAMFATFATFGAALSVTRKELSANA